VLSNHADAPCSVPLVSPASSSWELLDGKRLAAELADETRTQVADLVRAGHRPPGLATILVGDDDASDVYVAAKHRACHGVGMLSFNHRLPGTATQGDVASCIATLNDDPAVSGILLQLPLPAHLDAGPLIDLIAPGKDVDGLSATSAGLVAQERPLLPPCTPAGVVRLLERHGIAIESRHAVIVGRSNLVGKPLASMLLARDATVTVCHHRTVDLERHTRMADIVVAACGVPRLLGRSAIRPDAVVIDVGITRTPSGLIGDVDFDAVAPLARAITPVPGGVGPMTVASLLSNTLRAAKQRLSADTTAAV
jgi:methylenetetrahydrofolate dehydrogenase (NADP+)/methenyltetrahydrofolate cyclohydrolase